MQGCERPPAEVSLDELARNPSLYDGHRVSARGELRYFPSPAHYWIESATGTRVEVIGVPDPVLRPGAELRVTGTFHSSRDRGRLIDVEAYELSY
jgi:hypothetical protein